MSKLELDPAVVLHDQAAFQIEQEVSGAPVKTHARVSAPLLAVFALAGPLAATAIYFIAGQRLWAISLLGALTLTGYLARAGRQYLAFPRLVFAFLLLAFLINTLGIAYPYSNIFVLTGLLGLFALSGMSWHALYFSPGAAGKWSKAALLLALGLAALTLWIYFWQPPLLGNNPTPKSWPPDVIVMMAIGYAIFSAVMEETIFRSVLLAHARECCRWETAVAAQATIFAMMHYRQGFPMNAAGAALALLWGLGAGWLVKKAGSIYPAYLMHFVVVLVLFLALAFA